MTPKGIHKRPVDRGAQLSGKDGAARNGGPDQSLSFHYEKRSCFASRGMFLGFYAGSFWAADSRLTR
jgi:hypothetical protein